MKRVDITNPVNGQGVLIHQRDIIELSGDGRVQVTTTNTYSGNGLVTIYAITSTGGDTLNDEGADPNQLVSITDPVAATTIPAGESFSVIRTAAYGDVLRGVAVVSPGSGAQSR